MSAKLATFLACPTSDVLGIALCFKGLVMRQI